MKRLRLIAIVVIVLLLGGLVVYLRTPAEPSYQGRTLTEWLKLQAKYHDKSAPDYLNPDSGMAVSTQVIQRIGTNGFPTLLRLIQAKDSPTKDKLNSLLDKQSSIRFRFETADDLRYLAFLGFGINDMASVPALMRLMQTSDPRVREISIHCLIAIDGGKGVLLPQILQFVHDRDRIIQIMAANYLDQYKPAEAEKAGVYKMFTKRKGPATNAIETNSPAAK